MAKKKNIVVANFPRFSDEIWMPFLWAQAKTYYELYGERVDEWNWVPCYHDVYSAEYKNEIKSLLRKNPPTIFAISLYVWNYNLAHEIASWVKSQWPDCVIISGGPHQYFKHDKDWFKKNLHLDASLPGDCYGELCFAEVLDNYDNKTKTIDWKKVTDMWYPSKSRMALTNPISMSKAERRNYAFDWSSMTAQLDHLKDFAQYQKQKFPNSMLLAVIETTRGCPYGCTYCDWGGGIATAVLQKSLPTVKQDINALMEFDTTYLYIADANFGIFGQRDVDIMKYLVEAKHRTGNQFGIGYGGYAKTENKIEYIRDILTLDIKNNLSMSKELKISLQTLDDEILRNIDRKNIPLDKQLEVYNPLSKNSKLPMYVELIMGLPGMTLDKFYYELDVLGKFNLSVQWFEWILLPETPAYSTEYRKQHDIKTVIKYRGWGTNERDAESEIVVGGKTFSEQDYLEMLLSASMYHLFVSGGYYTNVFKNIDIGIGQLIRQVMNTFVKKHTIWKTINRQWSEILNDPERACFLTCNGVQVYALYYFVALCFTDVRFSKELITWIMNRYSVSKSIYEKEDRLNINVNNIGKTLWNGLFKYEYNNQAPGKDINDVINAFRNFMDSGQLMRGKKKFLGVLSI